jgi:hypothetical protein
VACGETTSSTSAVDSGSDANADSSNVDCSLVGCAQPPLCSTGCTEVCGCCSCGEGQIEVRSGASYRCVNGCYAALDAGAETWVRFQVNQGAGPCPTENGCSWEWVVSPDGAVATTKQGVSGQATMSSEDASALDAILTSAAFQASMQSGFTCDPPPTDIGYSFTLELAQATYQQDVTGCITTGPQGNLAQSAAELVTQY